MANTKVIQSRLGEREIDMDKTIFFPKGLIGFEDARTFTLLQIKEDAPFLVLQDLENPTLGLLVADPYSFLSDYTIRVGDAEQKILQADSAEDLAILVTVSIPLGRPEETALNLTGPILINFAAKLGLQVPQADDPGKVFVHSKDFKKAGQDQENSTVDAEKATSLAPKKEKDGGKAEPKYAQKVETKLRKNRKN